MVNIEKVNGQVQGQDANNNAGQQKPEPPTGDSKNETKNEENGFVKAAKWTWSKAKSAGRFLWRHKGKVAAIFGTGVVTGVMISNMAHSGGSSELVGTDTELLTGTVDTPLMPDVDASVNVDVDIPDLVNVEDYMNV